MYSNPDITLEYLLDIHMFSGVVHRLDMLKVNYMSVRRVLSSDFTDWKSLQ